MKKRILFLTWDCWGGGRAKALLAFLHLFSENNFDVYCIAGENGWSIKQLQLHHGIYPDCNWYTEDWKDLDNRKEVIDGYLEEINPHVVVSHVSYFEGLLSDINVPTINYIRQGESDRGDERWTSNIKVFEFSKSFELDYHLVYPTWYIQPIYDPKPFSERPIDIIIHGRKKRDALKRIHNSYNVLLASNFTYDQLRNFYSKTKLFLFPTSDRFEPLGLMPIEAAACGCRLSLTSNSGVASIYPESSYERPEDHIKEILEEEKTSEKEIPKSPTDVIKRVNELI